MQKFIFIFLIAFSQFVMAQDKHYGQINIEAFKGQLKLPESINPQNIRAVLNWNCEKSSLLPRRHTISCGDDHKGQQLISLDAAGNFDVKEVNDQYFSMMSRFVRFTATMSFEIQNNGRWSKIPQADFTYYFDNADESIKLQDDLKNLALFYLHPTEYKISTKINTTSGVQSIFDLRQNGTITYQWNTYFQIYFKGLSSYNSAFKVEQRLDGDYILLPEIMHIDRYELTQAGYKVHFVPNLTLMLHYLSNGHKPHLSVPVKHHQDFIAGQESNYPAIWENIFDVTL